MMTLTQTKGKDDVNAALKLVLELAEGNMIDRLDNPGEYRKQARAFKLVRDTFGITD